MPHVLQTVLNEVTQMVNALFAIQIRYFIRNAVLNEVEFALVSHVQPTGIAVYAVLQTSTERSEIQLVIKTATALICFLCVYKTTVFSFLT